MIKFELTPSSGALSHDARLRCDMVDLYYALYGSKRPPGMSSAELSAMFKPQKVSAPLKGFVKAEVKSRPDSPIDEKPQFAGLIDDGDELPDEQIISVDDMSTMVEGAAQPNQSIDVSAVKEDECLIEVTDIKFDPVDQVSTKSVKEEIIDVDELDKHETIAADTDRPPAAKRSKTDFNHSDNSASLPGIPSTPGGGGGGETTGPVGFEPGMFKQEDDDDVVVAIGPGDTADVAGGKSKADGAQKVSSGL